MERLKNSGHPDQDERKGNPRRFEVAAADETEQRVGHKNEPSDRGEQNQYEKLERAPFGHEAHIEHRTGNQYAAYEATYECISADSGCVLVSSHSFCSAVIYCNRCSHRHTQTITDNYLSPAPLRLRSGSLEPTEDTESFVVTSLDQIKLPRCWRTHAKALGPF